MKIQQVKFTSFDEDDNEYFDLGGILVDDEYIICGCCGTVFPLDELRENGIIKYEILPWVNISNEILGE